MEPKDRLRKARRVLAVQAAIERLAVWSSTELEHRDASLQQRRADLVRFLDTDMGLGDVVSAAMLRRLHGLAESRAALKGEIDACAARRREERLRLRSVEKIVDALDRETRRIEELRELERVIEATQRLRSPVRSEQG